MVQGLKSFVLIQIRIILQVLILKEFTAESSFASLRSLRTRILVGCSVLIQIGGIAEVLIVRVLENPGIAENAKGAGVSGKDLAFSGFMEFTEGVTPSVVHGKSV